MRRTLVISNACFSNSISNGQTLAKLFEGAEKEKLAQFFVYGKPDSDVCTNYYCVSDRDALHSLNPFIACGGIIRSDGLSQNSAESITPKITNKTPLKMLIREVVWLIGGWKGKRFWNWVKDFNPERICLFLANNTFLVRLAIQCAKRYKIPVIVYSTEAYYFMDYNYLTNEPSLFYRVYYLWICYAYKRIAPFVTKGFFNSTLLRDKYEAEFHYPCKCVMNSSKADFVANIALGKEKEKKVSYLGNLGLKRHLALIEIAQTLQELNAEYRLDVYGAAPNNAIEMELKNCTAIRYHGFVTYNEVIQIIHASTLLIHTECNDTVTNRDLRYAFSTKIADSISSGTPLLLYANENLAETVFLKENQCAFIAHDKGTLREVLHKALTDEKCRYEIVENARKTKDKYFTGNREFLSAFE